jgi:hypothetical protein
LEYSDGVHFLGIAAIASFFMRAFKEALEVIPARMILR